MTADCVWRSLSWKNTSPAPARGSTCRSSPPERRFKRRSGPRWCGIPFGATASYGEIARAVGRPDASRAVGGANHRNPIAIIIPCHRVIGANGSMTGYGGGLPRKRLLLDLEARTASSGQLGLPGAL